MPPFLHDRLAAQHGEELLALAQQVFGEELNDTERALFFGLGVLDGRTLVGPNDPKDDLPELRAECVAWLLINPEAREFLTPQGVRIVFATINGKLDISYCQADLPLTLAHCHLDDGLTLQDAKLAMLYLSDSRCGPIVADRIIVKGSVFLRDTITKGEVQLSGADVGVNLECDGATFENPEGYALFADHIKVKGSVFLRNSITKGEVRLLGADVGGNLEYDNATLDNPDGYALSADGIKIKGDVFLRGTTAMGEVRLLSADVGGNLDCDGSTFENPKGCAFNADRIKVKGSIFLRNKFTAKGEVCLRGGDVGGNLDCEGATFVKPDGKAIFANDIKVNDSVLLREGFSAQGRLDFANATIEGWFHYHGIKSPKQAQLRLSGTHVDVLRDEKESWPESSKLLLDNFCYRIAPQAPWDVKDRLDWLKLQPEGEFSSQPYEQLAKVYREAGRKEDERNVLYAKNKYRTECVRDRVIASNWPERLWLTFTGLVFGYGYKPWRAVFAFGLLILFGFSLYALINGTGHTIPTALNLNPDGEVLFPFNPFYYSLDAAIPLVELGQTAAWTMSGWLAQGYNAFHTVAGWVIVLQLVGALTGLIKK